MDTITVPSLQDALAEMTDFRQASGRRHPLVPVLLLCCVAVLCGARSQQAIVDWGVNYGAVWRARLGLTRAQGPSQSTLCRILQGLDYLLLEQLLGRWAEQVMAAFGTPAGDLEGVAVDGKTLRGSAKQGTAQSHLLSLLAHRLGVVLRQLGVTNKSHELGAVTPLVEGLVLSGLVVTLDALHTRAELAQEIVEAGGDYLMVVKGNQPSLQEDIALVFAEAELLAETITEAVTTDAHGGRIETRQLRAATALSDYLAWPGHAQVLEMKRLVRNKKSGKERAEVVYGITSLGPQRATAAQLMKLWREHWHIENKLHWVRDVTFDEDRSQARAGHTPQVMAAIRNTAIGLLRVLGATNIAGACRHYAAQPGLALAAVGICFRE